MENKLKIGITQGDINGIGYEVLLKALSDQYILDYCTPIIYGSAKAASYHKKQLGIDSYTITVIRTPDDAKPRKVSLVNTSNEEPKVELGTANKEAGISAFHALEAATNDLLNGRLDAIVTAPINKASIQSDQFHFPGHTEYFGSKFPDKESLMILATDSLRIALATTHLPISNLANEITKESIEKKLALLNRSLMEDFGIIRPRIAVLGLNPHAGDNGLLGSEEEQTIKPAINAANAAGMVCVGPFAADGFFGTGNFKHYDAVLSMYHDQGLTAFKALAMENGVNITAGLPIVRTSPAHGTGYDIAGKNIASEFSMREAIYTAVHIVENRRRFTAIHANPLPFPKVDDKRPIRDRGGFNPITKENESKKRNENKTEQEDKPE